MLLIQEKESHMINSSSGCILLTLGRTLSHSQSQPFLDFISSLQKSYFKRAGRGREREIVRQTSGHDELL